MKAARTKLTVSVILGGLLLATTGAYADTVTWTGNGDATSWHDPNNWDLGSLPGVGDDAVIPDVGSTTTVVYSASAGSTTITNLTTAEEVWITGGTLEVEQTVELSQNLELRGGRLSGATISASGGAIVLATSSGGYLDGVRLNCDLDVPSGAYLRPENDVILNGTITLEGTPGYSQLRFYGGTPTLTTEGSGEVVLEGPYSQLTTYSNANVTIGSGVLIAGQGQLGYIHNGNERFRNEGTIRADVDGGTLQLTGNGWENAGTVEAVNNSTLITNTSTYAWSSSGALSVDNAQMDLGGTLAITGLGAFTNVNGTVNLTGTATMEPGDTLLLDDDTGSWYIKGGRVQGGTMDTTDSAEFITTSSGGYLDGVRVNCDLDVPSGAYLRPENDVILNGTITLEGTPGYSQLRFYGGTPTLTTEGSGEVVLEGPYSQLTTYSNANVTIGSGVLIAGQGQLGYIHNGNERFRNEGTIRADVDGGTLQLIGNGWENAGTVEAVNNSTLITNTSTYAWSSSGALSVDNAQMDLGGTLAITGLGTFTNVNGTVNLVGTATMEPADTLLLDDDTGSWYIKGGRVQGGTMDTTESAEFITTSSGGYLDGVRVNCDLDVQSGAYLRPENDVILNGTITLEGTPSDSQLRFYGGTPTLTTEGSGEVALEGPYSQIRTYANADVTIGLGVLIAGQGQVGYIHNGNERFRNEGTIRADVDGGTLQLIGNGWENAGAVEAVNNSTLITNTSNYAWNNSGLMRVETGSLISGYWFTQSSAGILSVGLSGVGAGEFGMVSATNTATLAGTVHAELAPDYIPSPSDAYAFMEFGSLSGAFDAVSCSVLCVDFDVTYDSSGADLYVLAINPPEILAQPQSQTVCEGDPVTFSVDVAGLGLWYQWYKDGEALPGETGPTLELAAVTTDDAGDYHVVVANECGELTSDPATLTVYTAPEVTTQPVSQEVCEGDPVTFSVVATGTPAPTYQWRKDGVEIPDATESSYTIDPVTTADAGDYDVVVTNVCGEVISDSATLTVDTAPGITTHPISQEVCEGDPVTFSVVATGAPAPTYQWRKDGEDIDGATESSHTITSVTTADAGDYDVVVTNVCGEIVSDSATLTVDTAPGITTHPVSQEVCEGDPVTFSVVATGTPALTYQWRQDGEDIDGATASSYTITSVTTADAGAYDIVVTNICGEITSDPATLTVDTAAVITTQPVGQDVCEGDPVTFSVEVEGTEPYSYQWRKDGADISGATGASYTIESATPADAGSYDVVVTNVCGEATSDAVTLTVDTAPVITQQPESQEVCEGDSATFTVVVTPTPPPSYQWRKDGVAIPDATDSSYTIAAATTDDEGEYDVVVTNVCGETTSMAATLTVDTAPSITEQPVSQEVCEGGSATFSVAAAGTPAPTYQWRKDGVEIPDATGSVYWIESVAADDAGEYDVVVINACGAVTSDPATLTVRTPCFGDLNGDCEVNLADLAQLLGHYGETSGAEYEDGDMDGDGDVDLSDLADFLGAYGDSCP